ncbi:Serine protease, subtilisin family [Geodermatophilus siccatus]|uniref:Serine protease, subtilisin family n=1 Tax=Geodermatophilus siccatus TaxID=1137991 RepID=A0A1G9XK23_9ACTN|nr:S8 family serine peptidase [Geodermatophilus siccatus]SDM97107.1 Serine protease, subtilisin family [Geodermatophilus siccatus]
MSQSRGAPLRRGALAVVLVTASVAGYASAAAYSALASPAVPVAAGFGPGDGLTRYVLTADEGVSPADLVGAVTPADGVVNAQPVGADRALVAAEGLAPHDLEALPGVADAEYSPAVPVAAGTVADPYWPQYGWNLENTGTNAYGQTAVADADDDVTTGWQAGTGEDVVVAVVDTGYDSDHPDLAGALWTNPAESCGSVDRDGNGKAGDCHGWNFTTGSADVDNGAGGTHGASVAGAVGARAGNGLGTAGVAPGVTIMPLVIGTGGSVDLTLGAEAIRYAADHGADVVNASWGGPAGGWALENLRSAVAYAASRGVVVVVAAGNDARDRDADPLYPASLTEANVVTVGSSTAADTRSDFSAWGAGSVDLFAPGTTVFTTWNDGGYRLVSGTSIASPQVAGAVALYRQAMPSATPQQLRQALLEDVDPVAALAGRSVTGGRLSLSRLPARAADVVSYTFTSMTAPAGVVTPRVAAAGSPGAGDYGVTLGLGMEHEGEVWAVSGVELTVGSTTLATDDTGTARFPLGRAAGPADLALSPSVELGDGRYVLTVQLDRDGTALGRTYAAPLLVGTVAEPAPGRDAGTPGTGPSGPAGPGSGGSGSAGSGSGSAGPGSAGTGTGTGGQQPGSSGSGGTDRSTSSGSGSGSGSTGGGSGPSGSGSGSGSDGADPSSGDGGSGASGSGRSDAGSGSGSTPDVPSGRATPSVPDVPSGTPTPTSPETPSGSGGPTPGGQVVYPSVGPFGITSLSPARVGTAGGTLVTITGTALPADPRVRIGDSAAATVVRASATQVVVRVPARAAGVYDVHVFAPDGRLSVLTAALTYTDATGGTAPGGSTPGGTGTGGTGGSSGSGGSSGGTGGGSGSGSDGSAGAGSPGDVRTGPGGLRLVRSAAFSGLRAVWSTDCSTSCRGVRV